LENYFGSHIRRGGETKASERTHNGTYCGSQERKWWLASSWFHKVRHGQGVKGDSIFSSNSRHNLKGTNIKYSTRLRHPATDPQFITAGVVITLFEMTSPFEPFLLHLARAEAGMTKYIQYFI
jgi:hypothetical protein